MPAARARTPARALTAAVAAVAATAVLALAGCSGINAALSKQWAVVNFKPDTTVSTLLRVRATCSHVPNLPPVTASSASSAMDAGYSVRYEASHASGANLAALRTCLKRFTAVSGVWIQDVSDKG